MSAENTISNFTNYIEILRQRFFVDHSSKAKTFITEEYTIISHHNNVTNIILQFPSFLPNLKVYDDKGDEITVMSNTYTRALIESWADESQDEIAITELLNKMNRHEVYVIWLKLQPCKTLMEGQTIILNFEYSAVKEKRKTRDITLSVYPTNHSVFYIIKKPEDFDFGKRAIIWFNENNEKHTIKNWSKEKELLYVTETNDSTSLTTKPENQYRMVLNYTFRPKFEIVAVPTVALILLSAFAVCLGYLQTCNLSSVCAETLNENAKLLIDKRLEFGAFIITSSLVLPRLINNTVIRQRILVASGLPIFYSVMMMLGLL